MSKILITGVSGFIGQALVSALSSEYEIYGLYEQFESRKKNADLPIARQFVCDLRNKQMVEYIVGTIEPDYIIHLAARSEVANSFDNYAEVGEINYGGTVNLAEASRRFNPNLKNFVMASTMETYGHFEDEVPATEKTPQRPMAPYAVAKVASEKYLEYMAYAYDFPYTILRQTNTYGRHDNDFFVVERVISQMLDPKTEFRMYLGDPTPQRNFLHIDDLVELYKIVLTNPKAIGETFVTGPNNAISILSLVSMIGQYTQYAGEIEWYSIPRRPGEIFYLNSLPRKARKLLGWEPKVELEDGLIRTVELWRPRYEDQFEDQVNDPWNGIKTPYPIFDWEKAIIDEVRFG